MSTATMERPAAKVSTPTQSGVAVMVKPVERPVELPRYAIRPYGSG